ncbi:glucan 1,3-beta-glucosidase [Coprinopsis cinerea okayama7|uniref:Glucan 1,3-beta-glucosidase n=1 Tax=Coprinopsis cinerea (strain Okayama-7 / 130 / ATCC MYA-4618 / FGSC 9003) TaxID=240176 RepID=A8NN54_COPC7|nr:glucan 1,3-beta-glucosidase [Coprinopsis cinerea okayama7\|eukprot:XP_001835049.2 glucan 1,3-beta-glucosidase [Coprinopsis cinerea okayama7\
MVDPLAPPRPFFLAASSTRDPHLRSSPTMPRQGYAQVDATDHDPSPVTTPRSASPSALFQPSARPPPSSFAFPFQAYPGNPDPGMSIPGYTRRRSSLDSLYRGQSPSLSDQQPITGVLHQRSASVSDDLPPPNPPFMSSNAGGNGTNSGASSEANSLRHSSSSNSLYKGSAAAAVASSGTAIPRNSSNHSFRTPFLSPASRPSSWAPPAHLSGLGQYADTNSASASSTALALAYANGLPLPKSKPPGPSTRLVQPLTEEDKPWLTHRQPRVLTSYLLTLLFIFLGICGAAALCYFGYTSVPLLDDSDLCMVMNENFNGDSLDSDNWNVEIQMGGFGNGEFQMTSAREENLFIKNGQLYMYPTLTSESLGIDIFDGSNYTIEDCTAGEDFTSYIGPAQGSFHDGSNNARLSCSASSNVLVGSVIPPAMSARINTKGKKSIRYGKVEIRAKLPKGDWLWPAVWMLPEENKYGNWPMSGEIDIIEGRGNGPSYSHQGSNYVRSSLNYGPLSALYTQIFGWQGMKRKSFDQDFHTYTLEWTPDFIRMFVDKRIIAMLEVTGLRTKKKNFWARGKYPQVASNWTADDTGNGEMVVVKNIWEENEGAANAPFDQPFFLIVNLAVGGTSGWFPDDSSSSEVSDSKKPWYDESQTAMRDFARAQDRWYKTWPENREVRSLRICGRCVEVGSKTSNLGLPFLSVATYTQIRSLSRTYSTLP